MTTTITPEQADTLPAEAIEAAAEALYMADYRNGELFSKYTIESYWGGNRYRRTACAALLAALPHLARPAAVPSEQEPVAWVHNLTKIVRFDKPSIGLKDGDYTPLYTHPAPAAGVKALEFVEHVPELWTAQTALCDYTINRLAIKTCRGDVYWVRLNGDAFDSYLSLDEAKAGAQADYEARILSALDTGEPK